MKKNIWYVSKYIAPTYAARVTSRGFLILTSLVKMGNNCTLIISDSNHLIDAPVFSGSVFSESIDGVSVHWLKTWKYKSARSVNRVLSWLDFEWRLFKMSKKELPRPDVIIISSLSLLTILNGLLLRQKYKCKLIFEVRDIWPMVLVESGGFSTKNPFILFLSWLEKLAYRKADKIVGTMPNLSEHIFNVTGQKVEAACIPQGVDDSLLLPPTPLTQKYIDEFFPKNKFIICHAGSIGTDNALETLFSCARMMQDVQAVHFLIVGDGYLKEKFQKENSDLNNVTFAPKVEKKQVQSVLNLVDVVYFSVNKSPLWSYGQSLNKVVDYMLSAKPILASYTGFPSMINEADCGIFVPAEDVAALKEEIHRLSKLPKDTLYEMGERGRNWIISNRRYDCLAEQYLSIISEL
ncbi:glycosyltransferase family 4 protein [Vibrio metschnikovii]|uniref:glycosyltransferase family 4 protein n=1 Tax=Vibrio metschnikovii TaxID=28172 RepID=UPI001C30A8A9|nr:glycosyltransferase family 4 protein [Vibrio metschnikovii]EKO3781222.1 glycosyltransferase family 4 protein [Vibrio metschnikovii]EKO3888061.1 glycosyltransferase family 4 protein [Vibrio metschnikovii]